MKNKKWIIAGAVAILLCLGIPAYNKYMADMKKPLYVYNITVSEDTPQEEIDKLVQEAFDKYHPEVVSVSYE
jgi:predicted secreted protein